MVAEGRVAEDLRRTCVDDPRQRHDLSALSRSGSTVPCRPTTRTRLAEGSGDQTTSSGPVSPEATRADDWLPSTNATSQGVGGTGPSWASTTPSSSWTTADHSRADGPAGVLDDGLHELVPVGGPHQDGHRLRRVGGDRRGRRRRPDLLDVDAVHLLDLGDEQLLERPRRAGPRPAGRWLRALEDVDADDLPRTTPMRLATWPSAPGRSGSHMRTT